MALLLDPFSIFIAVHMEDSYKKTSFYVYQYIRVSDNTPYYIGKGIGWRMYCKDHSVSVPKDRTKIQVIANNLTENEAHLLEKKLVALYGRKDIGTGILHNHSNGGEGSSGAIRSKETREKIAKALTGRTRIFSEEHKRNISTAQKGKKCRPFSEQHKAKIGLANKGKIVSLETTKKWRHAMELRKQSGIKDIRNIRQVTCPYCNKIGGGGNMTRYHFNNCKSYA